MVRSLIYCSVFAQTNMSSSRDPEEEMTADGYGALQEVNSHVKEVFAILKRETVKVRKEMEAFDAVAKKLKHVHFSKTLKLNVGGQLFSTSLETMKKDPGKLFFHVICILDDCLSFIKQEQHQ